MSDVLRNRPTAGRPRTENACHGVIHGVLGRVVAEGEIRKEGGLEGVGIVLDERSHCPIKYNSFRGDSDE